MPATRSLSRFALALAALATLLQLAVPHGWMMASAQSGAPILIPCPTVSPELVALAKRHGIEARVHGAAKPSPHAHHAAAIEKHGDFASDMHSAHAAHDDASAAQHDAEDDGGDHDAHSGLASALCDFAAMGAPAMLPDPPVLDALPPEAPDIVLPSTRTVIPGRGLAAPPPPSTGPPITA